MDTWWLSLSTPLQTFYVIAILGMAILALQTILIFVGAEHLDSHDGGLGNTTGEAHQGGLALLSLRTLTAFTTGFGWSGVILTKWGVSVPLTVAGGVVIGVILAWSIMWLMRSMHSLASDGTMNYANAVNAIGTVIVSIQPQGRMGGQIEVMIQDRLAVVSAIGDKASGAIAPGSKVRITEVADATTLRVAPA